MKTTLLAKKRTEMAEYVHVKFWIGGDVSRTIAKQLLEKLYLISPVVPKLKPFRVLEGGGEVVDE